MGIKRTYQCDKCKTEWPATTDNKESVVAVRLTVSPGSESASNTYPAPLHRDSLWCRKCAVEHGLIYPRKCEADIAPEAAPSMEDKIVDALEGLGFVRE